MVSNTVLYVIDRLSFQRLFLMRFKSLLIAVLAFLLLCTAAEAQTPPSGGPGLGWDQGYGFINLDDPVLMVTHSGAATNERVLTVGASAPNITLTDGGPNTDLSIGWTGALDFPRGGTNAITVQGAADNILNLPGRTTGSIFRYDGTHIVPIAPTGDGQYYGRQSGVDGFYTLTSPGADPSKTYVTVNNDSVALPNSRQAAVSSGITKTDGGAGSTLTIGIDTAVVATTTNSLTMTNKTLTTPILTSPTINTSYILGGANAITHQWNNPAAPRTITWTDPGGPDSPTYVSATQTLTNKTLTTPIFNTNFKLNSNGGAGAAQVEYVNTANNRTYTIKDSNQTTPSFALTSGTITTGGVAYGADANTLKITTSPGSAGLALTGGGGSTPTFNILTTGGGGTGADFSAQSNGSLPYINSSTTMTTLAPTAGLFPQFAASSIVKTNANSLRNGLRLYTQAGKPFAGSNGAAIGTIKVGQAFSDLAPFFNGTYWDMLRVSEASLTLSGLTANNNYDIYVRCTGISNGAGTLSIETPVVWTNDTTPPTRTLLNGIYVGSASAGTDNTRILVGSIRAVSSTTTIDTVASRWVSSIINPIQAQCNAADATASWTYASSTVHAMNGNTTDGTGRFSFIQATDQYPVMVKHFCGNVSNNTIDGNAKTGIGYDSTSSFSVSSLFQSAVASRAGNTSCGREFSTDSGQTVIGFHFVQNLEATVASVGTMTVNGSPQQGMFGVIWK